MEDRNLTHKDYLRVIQKRLIKSPNDETMFLQVLHRNKKKWSMYTDPNEINFDDVDKAIVVFKEGNPMFVRTLDDEYAMQNVNLAKKNNTYQKKNNYQKNNRKYYKKRR